MEISSVIQEAVDSCDSLENIEFENLVDKRVSPGMLVVAPPMRILYITHQARELVRSLSRSSNGSSNGKNRVKSAQGLLPVPLHQVCGELFHHLRELTHAKDWERFEIKRLIHTSSNPVLIRGFGLPDHQGFDHSRIVLLMEAIGRRKEETSEERRERFQLTGRQLSVVQCLANGWTNKEIANELKIALPTVKEHIRHIMEKTKTTTRTGILVQMYRA